MTISDVTTTMTTHVDLSEVGSDWTPEELEQIRGAALHAASLRAAALKSAHGEWVAPRYRVGDPAAGGAFRVHKVVDCDDGSQLVWTTNCPDWCVGHEPSEHTSDGLDQWTSHVGRDFFVPFHDDGSAHLSIECDTNVPGSAAAPVELHLGSASQRLTSGEARMLAEYLVHMADTCDGLLRPWPGA